MIFRENAIDRVRSVARNFDTFKRQFALFTARAVELNVDTQSPVRGLMTMTAAADGLSFTVDCLGVLLLFQLSVQLQPQGAPKGVVRVFLLQAEVLKREPIAMGSFSFAHHGMTDIETGQGEDAIEMDWAGQPVVIQFLEEALGRSIA